MTEGLVKTSVDKEKAASRRKRETLESIARKLIVILRSRL